MASAMWATVTGAATAAANAAVYEPATEALELEPEEVESGKGRVEA